MILTFVKIVRRGPSLLNELRTFRVVPPTNKSLILTSKFLFVSLLWSRRRAKESEVKSPPTLLQPGRGHWYFHRVLNVTLTDTVYKSMESNFYNDSSLRC